MSTDGLEPVKSSATGGGALSWSKGSILWNRLEGASHRGARAGGRRDCDASAWETESGTSQSQAQELCHKTPEPRPTAEAVCKGID